MDPEALRARLERARLAQSHGDNGRTVKGTGNHLQPGALTAKVATPEGASARPAEMNRLAHQVSYRQRDQIGPARGLLSEDGPLLAASSAPKTPPSVPMGRYGSLAGRVAELRKIPYKPQREPYENLTVDALRMAAASSPLAWLYRYGADLARSPRPQDSSAIEDRFGEDYCIAENGMMTCRFPGTGLVTRPFPQEDLPDRISAADINAHQYLRSTEAGSMEGLREGVVEDPTPGAYDRPATAEGTPNDALPPFFEGWRGAASPVRSIHMTDPKTGLDYVLNVTRKGHPLYPGVVLRIVRPAGQGHAIIDNYGVGASLAQSPASPLADMFADYWWPNDQGIIAKALEKNYNPR
jgi:hypothetical protein